MGVNKSFKRIAVSAFIILFFFSARAQDIATRIEAFSLKFSPERAYIHYDKAAYSPGETIWFKAYLLTELIPALESKTFYVDWIDDKGNLLQHSVSPLVNAGTNGQYEIPANYKGRYISVRGYTRWMLNFDTAFLYSKTIPVLNKDSLQAATKITIKPVLEFFPEGGDAIAGLANKIAFKARDQWGRPVHIKGIVTSADGKLVDSLRTQHDGMGFIKLTPKTGATYTAKWKDEKNVEYTTVLPQAKAEGASLQVLVFPDRRNFYVNLSPGFSEKMDSVHIVGTMFQHLVFKISRATGNQPITGTVPLKDLPYGVLNITVFDKNWRPLAERVTYINNNSYYTFKTEMEVERWGLSHRARNELKIKVPEPVASSLSISITDLGIGADSSDNILSHMMLASELKGKVNNPAYYFKDTTTARQQKLDLVMLTNGWRRFNWDNVLTGKFPKINYPKDTAYMSLSGNVMGLMPGQIGQGSSIIVMMKQKDAEGKMLMIPVNRDGTFNDPSTVIFDTAQVYYQFQDKTLQGLSAQFMPYRLRTPAAGKDWVNRIMPDTTGYAYHLRMANELNENNERLQFKELEAVTIKAKGKSPVQLMDEKYTSGLFTGDGIQLDLLNDPAAKSAIDIFSYLQGRVAGLQITGQGSNASLSWRGGAPQLYIDEMPADVNFVSSLNVRDVAYVKAFRPPFMGGFNGSNGAVAIYTRRGNDVQQEPGKGLPGSKIDGYTIIREFYSPKYFSMDVAPGADRDVRTTLYWNPNVIIDPATKQAVLSFYNNDVTDAFRVVIEGMNTEGKLTHYETTME